MTSGRDYKMRFEGDYIYSEWVNLPTALNGTMAFIRSELKKTGSVWVGTSKSYLPCQYKNTWTNQWETKWVNQETSIEIASVTATRIEGRSQAYPGGVDCKKGVPKGSPEWKSFTLIPKD